MWLVFMVCFISAKILGGVFQPLAADHLPKRIHFQDKTFDMRMNLAVMDWVCFQLIKF